MSAGTEKSIIFFPKTPVSEQEEFNLVSDIRVASGRITVRVAEGISPESPTAFYELDFGLRPINATLAGLLAQRFRELQASGKMPKEALEVIAQRLKTSITVQPGIPSVGLL